MLVFFTLRRAVLYTFNTWVYTRMFPKYFEKGWQYHKIEFYIHGSLRRNSIFNKI